MTTIDLCLLLATSLIGLFALLAILPSDSTVAARAMQVLAMILQFLADLVAAVIGGGRR